MYSHPDRILSFPSLLNARDLGGYPTVDGARTRWRSLIRSDDLGQLTTAGVRAFGESGIETVIDLRWPEEIEDSPSPVPRHLQHIRYVQISLLTPTAEQWREKSSNTPKEQWKCTVLEHSRAELKEVLQVIAQASPGPLLFHCVAGKDRTGLIAAVMLTLADAKPAAIAYDYAISGEYLHKGWIQRYPTSDPAALAEIVRCPEEGVHNMHDYLRDFGGIRGYLEQIGFTGPEIDRLRARLRD